MAEERERESEGAVAEGQASGSGMAHEGRVLDSRLSTAESRLRVEVPRPWA